MPASSLGTALGRRLRGRIFGLRLQLHGAPRLAKGFMEGAYKDYKDRRDCVEALLRGSFSEQSSCGSKRLSPRLPPESSMLRIAPSHTFTGSGKLTIWAS